MESIAKSCATILLAVWVLAVACEGKRVPFIPQATEIEDADYWRNIGMAKLKQVLDNSKVPDPNVHKAKNIIIFIGDGMGMTTITAGRIFKGQQYGSRKGEEASLVFDDFPHTGLAKTYNVDKQVPDSAGTATAMFCGVKTLYGVVGLDATCDKKDPAKGRLHSIMDWAQSAGKRTGIVTTTRITHATPAATYANSYDRDWECDSEIPAELRKDQVDIARQLVEQSPGKNFNVIMGGGLKPMGAPNAKEKNTTKFNGDEENVCSREDGKNLVDMWLQKESNGSRTFIQDREQLMNMDTQDVDHVLGLFRNNHLTYKIAAAEGEPDLKDMVEQAVKVLHRPNSNGYVLMVEGGRIDQAHHQNYARAALHELLEFDKAVETAFYLTKRTDTLIIVTADHSHSMTFNGYAPRGNDILGFANKTKDIDPYETLTYANGPGYRAHRKNDTASGATKYTDIWVSLEELGKKRLEPTYQHMSTFHLDSETHGGEDVAVFASGPGASLIRGVFEQNYLAYVMSYAGCMGPAKEIDDSCYLQSHPTTMGTVIANFNPEMTHKFDAPTEEQRQPKSTSVSSGSDHGVSPWKLVTVLLCLLCWKI